ncbi:hypothetical protein I316_04614 [Kwoniella heveanensis BCC8398]|uniref:Major facilitator superfamily (MFS) profile domain-containing protein n=1 Tax=Kwoniella heveanensis BCC8398 TaxID=1296120 RepID=A0A1B9GR50_9TREE|nr:hypothetical protein I316_04614 [Kwoniella heveanensis BCC8398]
MPSLPSPSQHLVGEDKIKIDLHRLSSSSPLQATNTLPYSDSVGDAAPHRGTDIGEPNLPASPMATAPPVQMTRVYKRRWFGLIHLSLLNIIVSWCWLTFAAVSTTSSEFFGVSDSAINWLSTGVLFAFVVASPVALHVLHKGVKLGMLVAAALLLVGSWLRYAGTRAHGTGPRFGLVVFGQVIIGFSQPFVLAAPTRYTHQWFTEEGRIAATALPSLCNPLGGALGQLIGPFIATSPEKVPDMVLYVAIICTVITIATPFLPSAPPLPPTHTPFHESPLNFATLKRLVRNPSFHLIAWPFIIYVAAFNATSSLLNQILEPYGLTEDQAGIDGAVMIVVGLLAAAIASPVLDRYRRARLTTIKLLVVTICAMYIAFIFVPKSRSLPAPAVISGVIGAASFILLPLALEMLADVTWPIGPEVSSTICWAASQLAGGILLTVMTALKGGKSGEPAASMYRSLTLQAVVCCVVAPLPMALGYWSTGKGSRLLEKEDEDAGSGQNIGQGSAEESGSDPAYRGQ